MNLKNHLSPLFFALLFAFTFACKDDDTPAGDTTKPVITITSPQDGATITAGSTINVSGTIEEAGELDQVEIKAQMGFLEHAETIEKENLPPKNGDVYAISQEFEVPSGISGEVTVTVTAKDAAGNTGTTSLNLTIE